MNTTLTPPPATTPTRRARKVDMAGGSGPGQKKSVLATVFMLAFLLYFLIPIAWVVISSTKTNGSLFSSFGFWFSGDFNFFENLRTVFSYSGGVFWHWMANSAWYSLVSASGAAALATAAGYGFAKFDFPDKSAMFGTILGAIAIPTTALAIPTYLLFSQIGIVNTPWAIILPSLVNPLGIYLMRAYAAESIPDALLEAGRIDGAGEVKIFLRVALPMAIPGVITVFLFSLVSTWNNYFLPLVMLNDPSLYPVTVGLAQVSASANNAGGGSEALFTVVVTGALVSIVPLIIAFLVLQRFWQSGLSTGAVK